MRIAAYQLLDFYHVAEHLQTFADAAFSQESERKDWFGEKVVLNYPSLQLSKHERGGTFFVVGDSKSFQLHQG